MHPTSTPNTFETNLTAHLSETDTPTPNVKAFMKVDGSADDVAQEVMFSDINVTETVEAKPYNLDDAHETEAAEKILDWWAEDGVYIRYDADAQTWYRYADGVYDELEKRDAIFRELTRTVKAHNGKAKVSTLNRVITQLTLHDDVRMEFAGTRADVLPLANGVLNMNTREFVSANPDLFYTQRSEVEYDPTAVCPTFTAWLDGALPDKQHQNTLLEYMAYSLTGYTHLQKFMFLFGSGGTGKGTVSRVLQKLSGGFFASSDLNSLSSSRFATYSLRDKRLALISEVSKKKVNLKTLKQITGEDAIQLERKYRDPYHKKLDTKLFITANEMFSLGADTNNDSVDRRLIILPFNVKQTDNPDLYVANLEQRLDDELSGILNLLLEAWERVQAQGGFTLPHGDEDLFRDFLQDANLVMYFFSSEFEAGTELGDLQARELYDWYREWCRDTGNKRETETSFFRSLKPVFEKLGWDVQNLKPNNKSMWRGLTLKADSRLL